MQDIRPEKRRFSLDYRVLHRRGGTRQWRRVRRRRERPVAEDIEGYRGTRILLVAPIRRGCRDESNRSRQSPAACWRHHIPSQIQKERQQRQNADRPEGAGVAGHVLWTHECFGNASGKTAAEAPDRPPHHIGNYV